jgi:hypothetical protein
MNSQGGDLSSVIQAEAVVSVGLARARQWFLDLREHPERYHFETHAGFEFTEGDFGQVGAHFVTRERFYGVRLGLHFELTEVGERHFEFRVIRPSLPIWGAFSLQELDVRETLLCLEVGAIGRAGRWLLDLPGVQGAIGKQIRSEVMHVKASMETAYGDKPDRDPTSSTRSGSDMENSR